MEGVKTLPAVGRYPSMMTLNVQINMFVLLLKRRCVTILRERGKVTARRNDSRVESCVVSRVVGTLPRGILDRRHPARDDAPYAGFTMFAALRGRG